MPPEDDAQHPAISNTKQISRAIFKTAGRIIDVLEEGLSEIPEHLRDEVVNAVLGAVDTSLTISRGSTPMSRLAKVMHAVDKSI